MTLTQLQVSARYKCGPTITSAEYPDAALNASINEWYRTILSWVMLQSGIWEFKGNSAVTDLIANQSEYVLPTDLIIFNRAELKYAGASNFVKANRIDDKSVESAFANGTISEATTVSQPRYRMFDNSIFVYPAPSADSAGGLSIEFLEDITDLASGTDVPNLNPLIHKAISIGAAYDFCISQEMFTKANAIWVQMFGRTTRSTEPSTESLKWQIEQLAAQRDRSERGRLNPRGTSFR